MKEQDLDLTLKKGSIFHIDFIFVTNLLHHSKHPLTCDNIQATKKSLRKYQRGDIVDPGVLLTLILLDAWGENKGKHDISRREINAHGVIIREADGDAGGDF